MRRTITPGAFIRALGVSGSFLRPVVAHHEEISRRATPRGNVCLAPVADNAGDVTTTMQGAIRLGMRNVQLQE